MSSMDNDMDRNTGTGAQGAANPRHWAAINEISFVAGMRLLFLVFRVAGRWPFRLMLYPVLLWYVLTQGGPRRASRTYLTRVRAWQQAQGQANTRANAPVSTATPPAAGGPTPMRVASLFNVLQHFAAFAEVILDKMLLWGGLYPLDNVRFHGIEVMNRHIEEKRGTLLICSHLGNVELCRVLSRQRSDLKLTVLVHTKHAQAFNRMLARLDPASGLNLLQVTEMTPATAMLLAERIGRGEFVVIAGDRVPVSPNPRVALADFLGQQAAFPIGPYVLASILQCPLYMLFCHKSAHGSDVYFELLRDSVRLPRQRARRTPGAPTASAPPAPPPAAPAADAMLAELVADYATHLQAHCLRAPLQWFNFYDFWHLPQPESADAAR